MRSAVLAAGIPLRAADVELSEPVEVIAPGHLHDGTEYTVAMLLARLHGVPLGEVTVSLPTSTPAVVEALREQLGIEAQVGPPPCGALDGVALPSVTVVVATCGRPLQAARCVAALLASDYENFEVIVVDNDPADRRTADALRQLHRDVRVRYIVEPVPGCSRARNTGIAHARGDVVAFTDDDVVVDRGWLSALARTFASDPNVACVTGLTLPYRLDTAAQRDFERVAGFSGGYLPVRYHRDMEPRPTRLFPFTAGIAGSSNNLAVTADVLRKVGGFDVRLGPGTRVGGAEDLDLLTRILLAGDVVRYEPSVLVRHEHRVVDEAVARQIFSYGSGATAVLMKWATKSPALRRRLASELRSLGRELARVEVTRDHAGASEVAGAQTPLRVARVLGYIAGPALWLVTLVAGPAGRRRRR